MPRKGDEEQCDHLFVLAGHRPPAGRLAGNHVRPGLLFLLDQLNTVPAQILSDLGDVLAQNSMSEALFGSVCSTRKHDRDQDHNIVWRWFNDPRLRAAYPADEHDYRSRLHVADLRATRHTQHRLSGTVAGGRQRSVRQLISLPHSAVSARGSVLKLMLFACVAV